MEFRFTYNNDFEQTFRLESNLKLKLKSLESGTSSSISFINDAGENIPSPDNMYMDKAIRINNVFVILSNEHIYKLIWNDQVVFKVIQEHIIKGCAYIPPKN